MVTYSELSLKTCSSAKIMTLYYTDVASIVHSFDREQYISDIYMTDNVAYGHTHVKVLQYHVSMTIMSIVRISCNSSNRWIMHTQKCFSGTLIPRPLLYSVART